MADDNEKNESQDDYEGREDEANFGTVRNIMKQRDQERDQAGGQRVTQDALRSSRRDQMRRQGSR